MVNWSDFVETIIGILAIVNPVGAIPIFMSVTDGESRQERKRTAFVAAVATGVIMLVAAWAGEPLLRFFGIEISSFRIGGGILILLMAISMMHARHGAMRHTSEEAVEAAEKENVGVVPLAIPLLAGPGTISTVILNAHASSSWTHMLTLNIGIVGVAITVWSALRLAVPISSVLGRTGMNVVTRLMGVILLAIGVEFITGGIGTLFPGLK